MTAVGARGLALLAGLFCACACSSERSASEQFEAMATGAVAPLPHAPSKTALVVRRVHLPGSDVELELVWVPAAGVWVGRTEVTWDAYLFFCDFEERRRAAVDGIARPSRPLDVEPFDRGWGLDQRPAIGVSRDAAQVFCAWLSRETGEALRLPDATEWLAACAPSAEDARTPLDERAHTAANAGGRTHAVGELEANDRGLFDTLGNAAEYVSTPAVPGDDGWPLLLGGSFRTDFDGLAREGADAAPRQPFDFDWTLRDSNYPPGVWWLPDGEEAGFRIVSTAPAPDA
jgi:formylglycine-generating enzyme required for sulfatase activity